MRTNIGRRKLVTGLLALTLAACSKGQKNVEYKDYFEAIYASDRQAVARMIAEGRPVDERDYRGDTPFGLATATDQHIIAEMLLDAGADPFAMDSLYSPAASGVYYSNMSPDVPKGQARLRVLKKLEAAGVPLPPPRPKEFPQAFEDGRWPMHAVPPPRTRPEDR